MSKSSLLSYIPDNCTEFLNQKLLSQSQYKKLIDSNINGNRAVIYITILCSDDTNNEDSSVCFDNKLLLGVKGTQINIYDLATNKLIKSISESSTPFSCIDKREDDKLILFGNMNKQIKLLAVQKRAFIKTYKFEFVPKLVKFLPDRTTFAVFFSNGTLNIWDLSNSTAPNVEKINFHKAEPTAITHDGASFLYSGDRVGSLKKYNLKTGEVEEIINLEEKISHLSYSGLHIYCVINNKIIILDSSTNEIVDIKIHYIHHINDFDLIRDRIVICSSNRSLKIVSASPKKNILHNILHSDKPITACTADLECKIYAYGTSDGVIKAFKQIDHQEDPFSRSHKMSKKDYWLRGRHNNDENYSKVLHLPDETNSTIDYLPKQYLSYISKNKYKKCLFKALEKDKNTFVFVIEKLIVINRLANAVTGLSDAEFIKITVLSLKLAQKPKMNPFATTFAILFLNIIKINKTWLSEFNNIEIYEILYKIKKYIESFEKEAVIYKEMYEKSISILIENELNLITDSDH